MNPNSELPDGSLTSANFLIGAFHVRSVFGGFSAMFSPGLNRRCFRRPSGVGQQ
jgi:hypothetical protein